MAALFRTLAQRGRFERVFMFAREYESRPSQAVPRATHAEFVASYAFALAAADHLDEAIAVVDSVRGQSQAADPAALVPLVDALVSVRAHRTDRIDRMVDAAQRLFSIGALDYLVAAYRAVPEVLAILLRSSTSSRVRELILRVGDSGLAQAAGFPITDETDARTLLTRREREVYALLRQGLSNREIATLLVITEGTAKRHVQHIFDKLGVRSRRAIAMQAAMEGPTQATSAIEATGVGTDS
jgi:DNA-binding CsgD family transcriptional regulator